VTAPLLQVRRLDCAYGERRTRRGRAPRTIVHDVSFSIQRAETLALVGESGSGKTTIARAIAGLLVPRRGEILFEGDAVGGRADSRSRRLRQEIQYVFQNPDSSLNPRRRIGWTVGRPLELFFGLARRERDRKVAELLEDVHLDSSYMRRLPTQLSGGERQRVAIARALAADPKLVLCDEIVSALDVSVQATILDLLRELQMRKGIAYVFIAHDLAVVRWLAKRVVVLYGGHVLEVGIAEEVFSAPVHPYTEMLLSSIPDVGVAIAQESEEPRPSAHAGHDGCPFAPLCPRRLGPICDRELPPWRRVTATHSLRCHIEPAELALLQQLRPAAVVATPTDRSDVASR
jgi:peptide/nickel transport system ATP-binding protein